jgi:hypothetical protein
MRKKHAEAFEQFSSTIREETRTRWAKMVEMWILDRTKPNPYEEPVGRKFLLPYVLNYTKIVTETTLQEIRHELAKEDAKEVAQGIQPLHQTSLTSFLTKAFDLEEQQ